MSGSIESWFSLRVLATLLIPPVYIVVVSLAERRWGQAWSGRLTALPTQTTTIVLIVALEQGQVVAGGVAAGAILGIISLTAFAVSYGVACRWLAWPGSVSVGLGAFFLSGLVLLSVHGTPAADAVVAVAIVIAGAVVLGRFFDQGDRGNRIAVGLPARMVLALILVVFVAGSVTLFGPVATGLLGVFPIITGPMSVLNHRESGPSAVRRYLEGLEWGLVGGVVFFLTLSDLMDARGLLVAFAVGLPVLAALQLVCYAVPPRVLPRRVPPQATTA